MIDIAICVEEIWHKSLQPVDQDKITSIIKFLLRSGKTQSGLSQ